MVRYYSETPVCQKVSEDTEVLISAVLTVPHITEPLFIFFFQLQMHANKLGAGDGLLQMKETAIDHVVHLYRESLTLTSQLFDCRKRGAVSHLGFCSIFSCMWRMVANILWHVQNTIPSSASFHCVFVYSYIFIFILSLVLRMSMLAY